jgi:GNAT superfamily N-acetyltransferase
MKTSGVRIEEVAGEAALRALFPVVKQLRPHLDEDSFVALVAAQRPEGYRVVALYEDETPRGYAGFRVMTMLSRGRHVYVDDLVTDEAARSKGIGKALFTWLVEEAKKCGCARLQLDSGVQRHAAHRFYFTRRMAIQAYHFGVEI